MGNPAVRQPKLNSLSPAWLGILSIVAIVVVAAGASQGAAAGVVALVGVAAMLYLASHPVVLTLMAVAVVPVTSGLARGLPIPGVRLSEALVVFAAFVVILVQGKRLPGPRWTSVDKFALAYCFGALIFGVVDLALHQVTVAGDDLQTMLGPIQFFLIYRTMAAGLVTHRSRILAIRLILLMSIPVSAIAIAQQFLGQPVTNVLVSMTGTTVFNTPGFEPVFRATSVFPIWHALAGYILVVILLSAGLLLTRDREVLPVWGHFVVLVTGSFALLFSLTTTVIVGAVIGILIMGAMTGRLARVLTWCVVLGGGAVLLFYPLIASRIASQAIATADTPGDGTSFLPQTLQYRFGVWTDQYFPALNGSWLTGYGPAEPPGIDWHHTESGFITILLRGGLMYLILTAILITLVALHARNRLATARSTSEGGLAAAIFALAVVFPIINLVFPYVTASGLPQPLWMLWGILAASEVRKFRPASAEVKW